MRVGGRELIPINFRLIAATNRDLEDMITKGGSLEKIYTIG